ncbi:MAG TPA: HNH endonuclease signature motif containing protein [Anaerolineae bacterium]|nr:HNH endonuclease signature motif containing protein [Anaerolineae bacterium]
MSRTKIPRALRQRVETAARWRCGYCQTQQIVVAYPLHVDHIIPEAAGGRTTEDNLWLACSVCNNAKGVQTTAQDPLTGQEVMLFNPRIQEWSEHFAWNSDGVLITGLTPTGRATVKALQLNTPLRIQSRMRWVLVGWHPPRD